MQFILWFNNSGCLPEGHVVSGGHVGHVTVGRQVGSGGQVIIGHEVVSGHGGCVVQTSSAG